jgi:septum formation protein
MILGSSSKSRRKLVENLGWDFEDPAIDEKSIRCKDPYMLPLLIAKAKAEAIIKKRKTTLVTADQIILFKGEVREKPLDEKQAREFLKSYSQNEVQVINAIVVTDLISGEQNSNVDTATLKFGLISETDIDAAIERGVCFSNAGGLDSELYTITEGDVTTVMGLNMRVLDKIIKKMNNRHGHI